MDTSIASALVTHPEHARQSASEICAGAALFSAAFSSVVTSYLLDYKYVHIEAVMRRLLTDLARRWLAAAEVVSPQA